MKLLRPILTVAILVASTFLLPQDAGAAACTQGVDCLCDKPAIKNDPNVVFCEDFESPALNNGGPGWYEKYGATSAQCVTGSGGANAEREGTCAECCVNIVQPSACEVSGQTGCVFDGGNSMGHRLRPNKYGGVGSWATMSGGKRKTFGFTYAMRYSSNFVLAGPAFKHNEWGECQHGLVGSSTGNLGAQNPPFDGGIQTYNASSLAHTVFKGQARSPGGVAFRWAPSSSDYNWNDLKSQWGCFQGHFANIGSSNGRVRYWYTPFGGTRRLVIDVAIDLSQMGNEFIGCGTADRAGINRFQWNSYYNGTNGTDSGYAGSSIAYRYEDNWVVTAGPEPVGCDVIGFGGGGTGSLTAPGKPQLTSGQ